MQVEVTESDIRRGRRKDPYYCPIAVAVKRNSPSKYVAVTSESLFDGQAVYDLPPAATQFIRMFDNGYEVQPLSFELPEPTAPEL